jgi:hypothetical protein
VEECGLAGLIAEVDHLDVRKLEPALSLQLRHAVEHLRCEIPAVATKAIRLPAPQKREEHLVGGDKIVGRVELELDVENRRVERNNRIPGHVGPNDSADSFSQALLHQVSPDPAPETFLRTDTVAPALHHVKGAPYHPARWRLNCGVGSACIQRRSSMLVAAPG